MVKKNKKTFGLVNLRTIQELSKKEKKTIAEEEEKMEVLVEKKKKREPKPVTLKDLPKDDYDFILGHATVDGRPSPGLTGEEYIKYLLHQDKPVAKKKED